MIDYTKLITNLRITSGMIASGERIAWGHDSGIMDAAADAIESQAKRMAELLSQNEMLSGQHQAMQRRVVELEAAQRVPDAWKDTATELMNVLVRARPVLHEQVIEITDQHNIGLCNCRERGILWALDDALARYEHALTAAPTPAKENDNG